MQKSKNDDTDISDLVNARILKNAKRLVDDAQLLLDHTRFASAFGIAVLGLEEVGKITLRKWMSDPEFEHDAKHYGFHKVKQAVVGALYMAESAIVACNSYMADNGLKLVHGAVLTPKQRQTLMGFNGLENDDQAVEQVAKAIYESKGRRFSELSKLGALDKTKQTAFYVDEEFLKIELSPFSFTQSDAENMIERARNAIELSDDWITMTVAKAIYRTSLEKD